jgi:hypothetical protein
MGPDTAAQLSSCFALVYGTLTSQLMLLVHDDPVGVRSDMQWLDSLTHAGCFAVHGVMCTWQSHQCVGNPEA